MLKRFKLWCSKIPGWDDYPIKLVDKDPKPNKTMTLRYKAKLVRQPSRELENKAINQYGKDYLQLMRHNGKIAIGTVHQKVFEIEQSKYIVLDSAGVERLIESLVKLDTKAANTWANMDRVKRAANARVMSYVPLVAIVLPSYYS